MTKYYCDLNTHACSIVEIILFMCSVVIGSFKFGDIQKALPNLQITN